MTPRFLETLAREPRIVKYLDMPIQHASDAVLARMRRPERARTIRERLARVRGMVPGIAIRTTCIVGFPGETDADFEGLLEFLEEAQFDRVGAFTYSAQEGTRAHALVDDVPEPLKRERLERLTELQRSITAERYERHVGQTVRVLVDRAGAAGAPAEARAPWQADDIDGIVRIDAPVAAGRFVEARIDRVEDDYDFRATLVGNVDVVAAPRRSRVLPVTAATIGSYGR
jgi:ribosomal protein S12 methylthiotransferase